MTNPVLALLLELLSEYRQVVEAAEGEVEGVLVQHRLVLQVMPEMSEGE
jgi:hypothetical protein